MVICILYNAISRFDSIIKIFTKQTDIMYRNNNAKKHSNTTTLNTNLHIQNMIMTM